MCTNRFYFSLLKAHELIGTSKDDNEPGLVKACILFMPLYQGHSLLFFPSDDSETETSAIRFLDRKRVIQRALSWSKLAPHTLDYKATFTLPLVVYSLTEHHENQLDDLFVLK